MLNWWKKRKQTKMIVRHGFDNPLFSENMDLLGRKAITQRIYTQLTNLEPTWSVRVGLLAPWGEGKTTICNWIIEKAKSDGHIAFLYSPWSAKSDSELWVGLYISLMEALSLNKIKLKGNILKGWKASISTVTQSGISNRISEYNKISKLGLGLAQSIFKITRKDIQELISQLQGKRIIVIIDDLDRVDSALIPRLLMSLREILDIENFSFLLPFDEKIIVGALSEYNKEEGYGNKFLEKILDYREHIQPASPEQIGIFFNKVLQENCPFIEASSFDDIHKYLPKNPRKLKWLIRGLRVFETERRRHRDGEIDWNALLFAQMIKQESESFFQLYVEDTFGKNEKEDVNSINNPWLIALVEKGESNDKEKSRIEGILDKSQIKQEEKKERLFILCEGWRSRYGWGGLHLVKYALNLLDRPETLTWAEFDIVWKLWTNNKNLNDVNLWINEHAKRCGSPEEVVRELIVTLSQCYHDHLELASSVVLYSEQEKAVNDAREVLNLIDNLIEGGLPDISLEDVLNTRVFICIFDVMRKWVHFNGNESDKILRKEEKDFLKKWVIQASGVGLSFQYAQLFKKIKRDKLGFIDNSTLLEDELLSELQDNIDDVLSSEAIKILQSPNGIQRIVQNITEIDIRDHLVNVESNIWNPESSLSALAVLAKANINTSIQKNALDLLDLIFECSKNGSSELKADQVKKFYNNHQLISAIWNASIVTPLQFRRLQDARNKREHLISIGIEESLLNAPEWLMKPTEVGFH